VIGISVDRTVIELNCGLAVCCLSIQVNFQLRDVDNFVSRGTGQKRVIVVAVTDVAGVRDIDPVEDDISDEFFRFGFSFGAASDEITFECFVFKFGHGSEHLLAVARKLRLGKRQVNVSESRSLDDLIGVALIDDRDVLFIRFRNRQSRRLP